MHLLVRERVHSNIRMLQANMTGKWMLAPGVSNTREKRTPKSMVIDGVVPKDRIRTTLRNRTNIRGITHVRSSIGSRIAPR